MKKKIKDKFYTPTEIADMLKISRASVWRYIREKKLKAIKLGHSTYRISEENFNSFIEKHKK